VGGTPAVALRDYGRQIAYLKRIGESRGGRGANEDET
jgi:hypothetical protein